MAVLLLHCFFRPWMATYVGDTTEVFSFTTATICPRKRRWSLWCTGSMRAMWFWMSRWQRTWSLTAGGSDPTTYLTSSTKLWGWSAPPYFWGYIWQIVWTGHCKHHHWWNGLDSVYTRDCFDHLNVHLGWQLQGSRSGVIADGGKESRGYYQVSTNLGYLSLSLYAEPQTLPRISHATPWTVVSPPHWEELL